ncbi:hypothetical protein FC70_GL001490 [Paucilactobacillus oligofermentans DSM 15707 = LMG 22743]|uniref:VTT domain-containing protein n=1 Tax=Paucilactobacillus oligofermentans DSM 15707 = LMG 22743 TaxID=1423778 RepID=A0A0R1RM93_9LACO|nr:VTT domain-containing protein [Paucilactobacillus oligofermentans]KRL54691.1 hypothetical protein FC70_GL001490 [Paucilactobacillus oligofermentans DSM 15707 = LMG 22743]CUS26398.1 Putative SNARE associated Golgi protein [Paucilactobacillus oligofermentans DSM 15707 = LMG 22743]
MNKYVKHILITLEIIIALSLTAVLIKNYYPQFSTMWSNSHDLKSLLALLRNYSTSDVIVFSTLIIVVSAIPGAPASIFAIAAGICFGKLLGVTVSAIGFSLGNIIDVYALTFVDGLMKKERTNKYLDAIINMRHPRVGLVIGYAIPFIPSFMTSMAAVKMQTSQLQTISCIILGSTPIAFIYAFGGDALVNQHWVMAIILILIAAALIFLVIIIFKDRKSIIERTKNTKLFTKK